MKAVFCLLSAGVLATQAQVFRPIYGIQNVPGRDMFLAERIATLSVTVEEEELFSFGDIGKTLSNVGNQIGNTVTSTANSIADTVANDFTNGAGFSQAIPAWGNVNWQNGDGLIQAIQDTAIGCKTFYTDLNTLTGGNFNQQDLEYASLVASYVFPPAAIAIDAGQIILTLGTKSQDITSLCEGINSGLNDKNYVQVAIDAFQLFQIIGPLIA